jgi:AcrR family transcriptional regulator
VSKRDERSGKPRPRRRAKVRGRRGERDATASTILDAAEKLFAERGYMGVSVRDIGAEAGVSHALVHRYLGTKREIYQAVLLREESDIRAAAGDTEDLATAMSLMMREGLASHQQYLRIIASSALGGLPFDVASPNFAATQRLVELAEAQAQRAPRRPGDPPARLVIAAMVSLYLGWVATAPWLLPATGLTDLDEAAIVEGLEKVLLGIANEQFPASAEDAS